MSEVTVSKLDGRLKEIEAEFQRAVQAAVQARDEQVRLRGEFDAITKLKADLEKKDEVKDG
jgi:hypothetical protein